MGLRKFFRDKIVKFCSFFMWLTSQKTTFFSSNINILVKKYVLSFSVQFGNGHVIIELICSENVFGPSPCFHF